MSNDLFTHFSLHRFFVFLVFFYNLCQQILLVTIQEEERLQL